jgi:3-dehydroquinate synthase
MNGETAQVLDLPAAAVYEQQFTIRYDYPVYFTEGIFDRGNPVFEQALCRREPAKRHRFAVFMDANVASCWPALPHEIAA